MRSAIGLAAAVLLAACSSGRGSSSEVRVDVQPGDVSMFDIAELLEREGRVALRPVWNVQRCAELGEERARFLPLLDGDVCFELAPTGAGVSLDGNVFVEPEVTAVEDQWGIDVGIAPDALPAFNAAAAACFEQSTSSCPTGQLAIVSDDTVISAPQVQQASFDETGLSISGSFTELQGRTLAAFITSGPIPALRAYERTTDS